MGAAPKKPAASAAPAAPSLGRRMLIAAILFSGTLLLFSRVWWQHSDFVNYDDPDYVTANPHVKAGLHAAEIGWAMKASVASNWHPLTWMSHMLDWSLYGPKAGGHHGTSVVLHALNAALAFLALWRLTGALWTSAVCAALFAWHPLRAESVAWVAERKDVLSGLFWFLALWLYAHYVERKKNGIQGAMAWYAATIVAFALGLMAKPMLVTLPCVLLLLDVWPLRRMNSPRAALLVAVEKLPFFALTILSCVVTYVVQKGSGAVTNALSFEARLANAVVAVVRYLGKFFAPVDLAVLYPHPGEWPTRKVVACLVIVLALSATVWLQRRRRPWLAIGWLWFLGTLVPVIGIVQVGMQAMADRYTYLTMFGVEIALLWTIRELAVSPTARRAWSWVAAVALVFCVLRTWNQLGVWKNSFTLFDHAIAVTENNFVAHDNRGLYLYKAGKIDEALADYRQALAINPAYLNANNNLGHALYEMGKAAEAIPYFRTALNAQPNHLEVHNNLANALSDVNQLDEAMEHYDFVLALAPDHANALNGSGVVLAMRGKLPEAKARIEKSLSLVSDNASAHNNLGNVCSMLQLRDEAVRHYRRAAELNPKEAHPLVLAGTMLNQDANFDEAATVLREAVTRAPNHPEAHAQLGFALARQGRREEAMRELRATLQLQPNHAQAKAWLEQLAPAK